MKRVVVAFILIASALAIAGFTWGFFQQQQFRFAQQRLALLERENGRLASLLAQQQQSTAAASSLALRAELEQQVSKIRELPFLEPVHYQLVEREEIRRIVEEKIAENYSEQELQNVAIGLAAIGVLEPHYPLRKKLIDLLSEQVAAFYDQHEHKLFMFKEASLDKMQNRIVLVHELVHALQDQHFQLKTLPLEIKDNDDRAMAASALVEGDATLVMSEYMLRNTSLNNWREQVLAAITQDMGELQNAPLYLRETLIFPYVQGQQFCSALHAAGGYKRISEAFKTPPSSTTQIVHPGKYLANPREDPVRIQWNDVQLNGTNPILDNVLGEVGVRALFAKWLDNSTAETASVGWRGDRYLVFENGDALIWKSIWASEEDAREVIDALREYLRKRYGISAAKPEEEEALTIDEPRAIRLRQNGKVVVLIDSKEPGLAQKLASKFTN